MEDSSSMDFVSANKLFDSAMNLSFDSMMQHQQLQQQQQSLQRREGGKIDRSYEEFSSHLRPVSRGEAKEGKHLHEYDYLDDEINSEAEFDGVGEGVGGGVGGGGVVMMTAGNQKGQRKMETKGVSSGVSSVVSSGAQFQNHIEVEQRNVSNVAKQTNIVNAESQFQQQQQRINGTGQVSGLDMLVTVPHHEFDMSRVQRLLALNKDFLDVNR